MCRTGSVRSFPKATLDSDRDQHQRRYWLIRPRRKAGDRDPVDMRIDHDCEVAWYSVRCIFSTDPGLYEERITLWTAGGFDEAIAKAKREADKYAEAIEGRYIGLAQAFLIDQDPTEGVEMFSLIPEVIWNRTRTGRNTSTLEGNPSRTVGRAKGRSRGQRTIERFAATRTR